MGVSNIQFWADLMDVSTVPSIQLDIAQLQAGFLQYSADVSDARQTLGDEIDASDAKAEAAVVGAEEARGIAVALLSRITQSETAAQAYTNAAVATLAQSLNDQLQTTKTAIQTAILTAVQGDVSAITPNLEAALNSALGSIQAEQTALGNLLTDFNSTTDAIFDDVLPKIQLLQNNVEVQVQEISEKFELFLTGSDDTTLITMLDNVRIQTAEGFVQAIKEYILTVQMTLYAAGFLPSTFVGGIDNWTRSRTGSPALVDSPVGATIVQDPDLGTAMEVTLDDSGVSSNILHKGVLHVSPGKVYRTQVKFKLYGASGSINLANILQLMDENYVSLFTGSYDSVTYAVSTNDVVTVSRTFCANAGDGLTAVTELAIARYMRFGLRRVSTAGSGSAIIRIGEITLEDLSDVYDLKANVTQLQSATTSNAGAIASLGTTLTAAIDDVAADVVINANALTTLNGNAAASYALRVGAGGASAGMEIVAANNPISGPASAIRLSAKHIEVLASSMRISDSSNVFPDFDMLDPLFYSSTNAAIYNFVPTTSVPLGAKWLNVGANAALKTVETNWFPIEPSTEYLVAGAAWTSSAVAGTGTSTVSFETGALNGSGAITVIESTAVKTTTDATYNSPSSFGEVSVLTASGARRGRFVVTRAAGGTGAVCAGAFKVQKKAGASLIVDGAFAVAGMSIFGGELKSSGYSPGSAGWRVTDAGDAEFNNLIVREDMILAGTLTRQFSGSIPGFLTAGDRDTYTSSYVNFPIAFLPDRLNGGQVVNPIIARIEASFGNNQIMRTLVLFRLEGKLGAGAWTYITGFNLEFQPDYPEEITRQEQTRFILPSACNFDQVRLVHMLGAASYAPGGAVVIFSARITLTQENKG